MGDKLDFKNVNIKDSPFYVAPESNNSYKIENVIERIEAGLVATYYIEDNINKPIIKKGDLIHFSRYVRLDIGDLILYCEENRYFIRRILKMKNEYVYVAGERERKCHRLTRDLIIAKAIARQRKGKNQSFNDKSRFIFYTFRKVNLSYFRVGNRVIEYQQILLDESLELAKKNTVIETKRLDKNINNSNVNIDLTNFSDPDEYAFDYLNGIE